MALFGFGKEKKEGTGSMDTVLAYLEDAQRVRAPFIVTGPKKTELQGTLQSVDEGEGTATFNLNGPLIADKGGKITFAFVQESLRIGGTARVADIRGNTVIIDLPEALVLMERRSQPRARLNPKEGATLTALTGLFEGVGITGIVENVSESGARIRVEKAMSLKGEKRLPLGVALVPPGQVFMLIKLNKVPKCPAVMELEGTAVSLDASGGGLTMGIAFSKPRADFAAALRGMVASRTTAIPTTLPPKTRRRPEAPSQNEDSFQRPAPPRPAPVQEEAPRTPEEAVKAVPEPRPEPEAPPQPVATEPAHEAPKNEAMVRLKKRSRAVVALAPSAAFSDILKDYLHEEGYGRVLVTHSVEDLLVHLQQPNLGLLLLDGKWGTMEGLEFVSRLKNAFHDLPPIILAAEDVSTSIVLAARRVGVAQMLVKPYAFDQTLSSLFIQQMGLS